MAHTLPAQTPASHGGPAEAWIAAHWGLALLGLTALALALRLFGLTHHYIWYDESAMLLFADMPWREWLGLAHRFPLTPLKAPLVVGLLSGWIRLCGESEWALRIPFALVGTASVPLLAGLCRRLVGPLAAVVAAALLAIIPAHVHFSQQIAEYGPMVLLGIASTWLWLRCDQRPRRLGAALALTAVNLALLLCHTSAVALPAVQLLLSAVRHRRAALRHWGPWFNALLTATAVAVTTVLLLRPAAQLALGWVPPFDLPRLVDLLYALAGGALTHGAPIEPQQRPLWLWPAPILLLAAAIWGAIALHRSPRADVRRNGQLLMAWLAAPIALLLGVSLLLRNVWVPRYALITLPPLCTLAASGLLRIVRSPAECVPAAALIALPMLLGIHLQWSLPGPSAREAAGLIRSGWHADDGLLVSPTEAYFPLHYYLHGDLATGRRRPPTTPGGDMISVPRTLSAAQFLRRPSTSRWLRSHDRIWLAVVEDWPADRVTGPLLQRLRARRSVHEVGRFPFSGMRLLLLQRPAHTTNAQPPRTAPRRAAPPTLRPLSPR